MNVRSFYFRVKICLVHEYIHSPRSILSELMFDGFTQVSQFLSFNTFLSLKTTSLVDTLGCKCDETRRYKTSNIESFRFSFHGQNALASHMVLELLFRECCFIQFYTACLNATN